MKWLGLRMLVREVSKGKGLGWFEMVESGKGR